MSPADRTIGQLVADSLRFYGDHFWASLALGIGPAVVGIVAAQFSRDAAFVIGAAGGMLVMTGSYVAASALVLGGRPPFRVLATAMAVGALIYVPFPMLALTFVIPGLAWFALMGLAVPAAIVEREGFLESLRRGMELGRADYVHALGTLATLGLLVFLTGQVMAFVIRGASGQALQLASFLAAVVLMPLIFIGAAKLYEDQRARADLRAAVKSGLREREES